MSRRACRRGVEAPGERLLPCDRTDGHRGACSSRSTHATIDRAARVSAAVIVLARDARKLGHLPLRQGLTFECPRCGATGQVDHVTAVGSGALTYARCDGGAA